MGAPIYEQCRKHDLLGTMNVNQLLSVSLARDACRSGDGRRLREAMGLSLRETAAALRVSPSSMSRWERGLEAPKGPRAIAYARLLTDWVELARG
jgi:DNA-binding transcriptional regulator YiaG